MFGTGSIYLTIFTPRHTAVKSQARREAGILPMPQGQCYHRTIGSARLERRASSRGRL